MAEELTPPAEGDELLLTPADEAPPVEAPPEAGDDTPDPVAALAAEMGWAPKEQFKGDPTGWKEPAEFIKAGRDIQRSMADRIKSMDRTLDTIAKTSATLFEQQMSEAKAKLLDQHTAAVEDGDAATAFKISSEISKLETTRPTANGPVPEAQAWAAKNPWFNTDPIARKRAIEVAEEYNKNGATVAEQLVAAERIARKEYPEHFPQTKGQASVNAPSRAGAKASGKRGYADLPPAAQQVAQDFLRRNAVPLETYATNYFASEGEVR